MYNSKILYVRGGRCTSWYCDRKNGRAARRSP
jgi:hypothetical protein